MSRETYYTRERSGMYVLNHLYVRLEPQVRSEFIREQGGLPGLVKTVAVSVNVRLQAGTVHLSAHQQMTLHP